MAIGLDVFFVVLFAAIGRRTHHEEGAIDGVFRTALPFVMGLVVAWMTPHVRRAPWSWRSGLIAAVTTVAIGMLLRRYAFDRGTALAFVIVASAFVAACLVGWRLLGALVTRAR